MKATSIVRVFVCATTTIDEVWRMHEQETTQPKDSLNVNVPLCSLCVARSPSRGLFDVREKIKITNFAI
jgi:hypothetical protein